MSYIEDLFSGVLNSQNGQQFNNVNPVGIENIPMQSMEGYPYTPGYEEAVNRLYPEVSLSGGKKIRRKKGYAAGDYRDSYYEPEDYTAPSPYEAYGSSDLWGGLHPNIWGRGYFEEDMRTTQDNPERSMVTSPTQISRWDVSPQNMYGYEDLKKMRAWHDKYGGKGAPQDAPEYEKGYYDQWDYDYNSYPYHENVYADMKANEWNQRERDYEAMPIRERRELERTSGVPRKDMTRHNLKSVLQGLFEKAGGPQW